MEKNGDREEEILSRNAHYGLISEYVQNLLVLSTSTSERKGLGILYYLLVFLQGKRKFPGADEISEVVGDCLDRNLGIDEFSKKWNLEQQKSPDLGVDDPEKYYLDLLQKLQLLSQIREGWAGWSDGSMTRSELKAMAEEQKLRLAHRLVEASYRADPSSRPKPVVSGKTRSSKSKLSTKRNQSDVDEKVK